jgi:hypothetical protein
MDVQFKAFTPDQREFWDNVLKVDAYVAAFTREEAADLEVQAYGNEGEDPVAFLPIGAFPEACHHLLDVVEVEGEGLFVPVLVGDKPTAVVPASGPFGVPTLMATQQGFAAMNIPADSVFEGQPLRFHLEAELTSGVSIDVDTSFQDVFDFPPPGGMGQGVLLSVGEPKLRWTVKAIELGNF